jgi:hypothetical protein
MGRSGAYSGAVCSLDLYSHCQVVSSSLGAHSTVPLARNGRPLATLLLSASQPTSLAHVLGLATARGSGIELTYEGESVKWLDGDINRILTNSQ